ELNEDVYYFTGNCYFKIGKHQKADEEYGKCLALNPQHVPCLNNLGVLHFHTGESDRSISELKKAAKYSTNSFEPKYNLACIKDDRPRENLRLSFLGERQLIAEGAMQF
ncbi:tetratricopeptide repeat protein, partial [candidate division KSB1 bacterium]|nr:tetratricopeptide repeat protein [candidate division KSB1 bacterium]